MPRISFEDSDDGYIFIGVNILETSDQVNDFVHKVLENWHQLERIRKVEAEKAKGTYVEPKKPMVPNYVGKFEEE